MVFCVAVFSGHQLFAADVAKIGVIDFQRILENSSAGKYAKTEIGKKGKIMETELKKRGTKIEEEKQRLDREALVMSKEMREEKEREIRININDFKTLQQKYMRDFKEFENRLVKRIQKEVIEVVKEMGKKQGYLIIMEKRTGEIVYSPKSIDMTDSLIQKYNTTFSSPNEKPKKKK